MLRPEQVYNAKFTPVSAGAYNAEEVDAFLRTVGESYSAALNENAALVKKISILADKVESYRNDEDAIKSALLDAHKMADSVTKAASEKSDALIADAEAQATSITEKAQVESVELSEAARKQAGDIVNNARTAVASLQERAKVEADKAVADAQAQAQAIIADAEKKADVIVGDSKTKFDYYTEELEKVKAELGKFKSMVEGLNVGTYVPAEIPEYVAPAVEETPVVEEAPVIEEPVSTITYEEAVEEAEEEPVVEVEAEIEAPAFEEAPAEETTEADDFFGQFGIEDAAPVAATLEEPIVPESIAAEADDLQDDYAGLFGSLDEETPTVDFAADLDNFFPEQSAEAPAVQAAAADDNFLGVFDEAEEKSEDDDDITSLFDSLFD